MNINEMVFFHHFMIFRNFVGGIKYKLHHSTNPDVTGQLLLHCESRGFHITHRHNDNSPIDLMAA